MATLNGLVFSPSKMEMKELNVCKLKFLVIKRPLNPCKSSFCISGSHLPPPANSHKTFGNQRILPRKNKMKATGPETWRDTGATDYGRGVGGKGWLEASGASALPWSSQDKNLRHDI